MEHLFSTAAWKVSGLIGCVLLFGTAFVLSVALGQTPIPFQTTLDAFFHYDGSNTEHVIVTTSRITRAIIAAVIGANLAIAGALMQALTRNPLAAPDLFGINAGALFFIVFAITFFSVDSLTSYMWIAFLGAAVASILVFFLGSIGRDGLTPIKIVLAGAAISALFVSFTQGMLVIDEQAIQSILFWMAGSVAGRDLDMLLPVLPFMLGAGLVALFLGRPINILLSGDDIAKGLGQRTILIKVVIGLAVVFLAGGSVAVAGSIGFVGLIVPHIARGLTGPDYRWLIPFSALIGASLLLLADVAARFIVMPQEMPIGVMTALIGAPFFVHIARKGLSRNEE
ncbi:FecCD family ABC transporter permease [Domibacillus enclensis]|uniref:Iron complex transport system permease protein n=1 Tax=Domibacillus enclensis TaxID=1017273 RepID=A0A1N6ZDV7_9BACI|nr:iron ABC transporter permease [Domibacillus enclensis]OXS76674.1 iron-siderophore ABC transporter permease [Domibacillus enclensis]SIR24951.1 iron complex transport system permease protein [Domibacillus enclensis]